MCYLFNPYLESLLAGNAAAIKRLQIVTSAHQNPAWHVQTDVFTLIILDLQRLHIVPSNGNVFFQHSQANRFHTVSKCNAKLN